jgi:hypothetical protein
LEPASGFVGFVGLGLVSLRKLIGHISLIGPGCFIGLIGLFSLGNIGITSLVGSLALSACWLIGLVGFMICSLATIAASAILSLVVATQAAEAMILTSATGIADVEFYHFASSSLHICLLVREKMC